MALFDGFEGLKFFSLYGLIAAVIIVIPNFIFAKKGQATRPEDLDTAGAGVCTLELLSRTVLSIVLVCMRFPVIYPLYGILAGVALLIYYGLWVRYFKGGYYYPDIYLKSFLGIPVPIDTFNIVYFCLVSLWLCNIVALCLTIVYGTCRMLNAHAALKDLKCRELQAG